MKMEKADSGNIYECLPGDVELEQFEKIHQSSGIKIERIVSKGQATPEGEWYDQNWDEWVVLLKGEAGLFIEGEECPRKLKPGDYVFLPAGLRHRVEWTSVDEPCVWLAIHFDD